MQELKAFIQSVAPMPDDEFELIESMATDIVVLKRNNLLQPGQVCKKVYFLNKGFFRLFYVGQGGNEINCRFCSAGNFMVDFQSFLTQKPSRYTWQAMKDAQLLAFKYDDIEQLYTKSHAWERFGRLMAERVYSQVNERIEMFEFLSPEERYLQLMDTQPELFNQVSQFHISSYLGIKPESLSRLRKRLVKKVIS